MTFLQLFIFDWHIDVSVCLWSNMGHYDCYVWYVSMHVH